GTHINTILSVVVDPQNKFAVSTSADGTARVWDTNSKLLLQTIRFPAPLFSQQRWLLPAAISRDGERIAFADSGRVFLYNRKADKLQHTISTPDLIGHLAFDKDGKYLAVSHSRGVTVIRLADGSTCNLIAEQQPIPIWQSEFDPSGRLIVCGKQ